MRLTEEDCSAEEDGGGFYISRYGAKAQISLLGRLEFRNCSAGGRGGGVFIEGKDGGEIRGTPNVLPSLQSRP